jgi:hypothetical protein
VTNQQLYVQTEHKNGFSMEKNIEKMTNQQLYWQMEHKNGGFMEYIVNRVNLLKKIRIILKNKIISIFILKKEKK